MNKSLVLNTFSVHPV